MWLVNSAGNGIDLEAFPNLHLLADVTAVEDNAHGQDVIDFLEGDMLGLHLVPDAIGSLDTCLYLVLKTCFIKLLTQGSGKLVKDRVQMFLHSCQLVLDSPVFLGVFVAEAQVLQLLFYLVQSQSVGQWGIDVQCLSGNLILFVG